MASLGQPIMGTTLTSMHFVGDAISLCHVGDSRCYRLSESGFTQLTQDHEAFDETFNSPVLASYLGIPTDTFPLQIQEEMMPVEPGAQYLLCSDGLYRQMPGSRVREIVRQYASSPDALVQRLCVEAATTPSSDNVTAIYIVVE